VSGGELIRVLGDTGESPQLNHLKGGGEKTGVGGPRGSAGEGGFLWLSRIPLHKTGQP